MKKLLNDPAAFVVPVFRVLDNLGIGAWVLIATVLFLAFKGVTRAVGRA